RNRTHHPLGRLRLTHIDTEVPELLLIPPNGRDGDRSSARKFDLYAPRRPRSNNALTRFQKNRPCIWVGRLAVDTQFQARRPTLPTLCLVGDTMAPDPNGHGADDADAGGQPSVGIRAQRSVRHDPDLPGLDFQIFTAQEDELTRALKIVAF